MKAIFLNGPPCSGKDTIGNMLRAHIPQVEVIKFAQPIIDHMTDTFGVSCVDGQDKSKPCPELGGLSRREYAIAYSEEWIKPRFGKDWFGRKAIKTMERFDPETVWVFTDSGFIEEAEPVRRWLGGIKCLQVKLHRPKSDFSDDSRGYWDLFGVRRIYFHNTMSKEQLPVILLPKIKEWLSE